MEDIFNVEPKEDSNWEEIYFNIKENWPRPGMDLSLDRIKSYLEFLGNPQDDLKVIHIAGTNGKGSTGTFIKSILEEGNLNIGFFSSPSIISDTESIKTSSGYISYREYSERLLNILRNWKDKFDENNFLSFFEASTIVAIEHFKFINVDIALFEVGLGGLLDSTNVFKRKLIDVITHIGLDHLGVLGNSIEEIAAQKAGVIQEGDRVLAYPIPKEALKVIEEKSSKLNVAVTTPDFSNIKNVNINKNGSSYSYENFDNISLSMVGENQIYNSTMAIEVIKILNEEFGYSIKGESIKRGLSKAFIPGRLEWIKYKGIDVLMDGAHNEDGIDGFVSFIEENISEKFNLVVGILKDKEYKKIYSKLAKLNCDFYLTEVPFEGRKLPVHDAVETLKGFGVSNVYGFENPEEAVEMAIKKSNRKGPVVITGSLYLIAKIRNFLTN